MAGADYRSCDVCGCKTFYDSDLDYDFKKYPKTGLSGLGDCAFLCEDCSETHEIIIKIKD